MNGLIRYTAVCIAACGLTSIAYAKCPTGDLLQARKLEALLIAQTNASKVHRALDNVMDSNGPGDPAFDAGTDFVIGLQFDPNNMSINIDGVTSTDASTFKANWANATNAIKYRKRTEDDWTLAQYQEDANCLRRITAYSTGKNYNVTNTNGAPLTFTNIADSSIRTVPTKTANYAADRFTVTLQEIQPPLTGRDCSFNFRIVSIKQITESRFLLPAVPVPAAQLGNPAAGPFFGVVSSPLEPIDPLFGDGAVLTLPIPPANC